MALKLAVALAALAGCTVDRLVLEGAITDCTTALEGVSGQPCNFDMTCSNATDCCNDSAYCRNGALVVDHACNPDCAVCVDDSECTLGAAICVNNRCVPCGQVCPLGACPAGWEPLKRNGCATCDCAPVATCSLMTAVCPNATNVCYRGAVCASGCAATDLACCSNQCAEPGCIGPIPTGCLMTCPPVLAGTCSPCVAGSCHCVLGQWKCTPICANGVYAACVAPN
jgi:hypothetical protein